jgi:Spy/CpxP family protein refolding chaperone
MAQQRAAFGMNAFWAGLELTQAQKEQVRAILAKYKTDIQALARDSVAARQELNRTIAAGASPDELQSAFGKAQGIELDVVKLRATIALEIRQILTADQLAKLQQRLQSAETRLQNRQKRSGN